LLERRAYLGLRQLDRVVFGRRHLVARARSERCTLLLHVTRAVDVCDVLVLLPFLLEDCLLLKLLPRLEETRTTRLSLRTMLARFLLLVILRGLSGLQLLLRQLVTEPLPHVPSHFLTA